MNNLVLKTASFIAGLFIMATGVALSVKANLGVSPISCIPYIYSEKYALTLGQITIIFNAFLIVLQILLLRRQYKIVQLVQLPVIFVFGFFIDLIMRLLSDLQATTYQEQFFWCLMGCVTLAFGVFLEVKAKLTYLPGEGLAMAITKTFNTEFGKTKIGIDSSMVIAGVISSFILLQDLKGVREGTVLAALLVGYLVKFYSRKIALPSRLKK